MLLPRKRHLDKFIKIKNINNKYKNRYKIQYKVFFIKYTIKNKNKILLYEKYKEKQKENHLDKIYEQRKQQLQELKQFRENKKYILTCYIPTYNQQNTIRKCLESILEQKTQYPFLIKILDDGSSDNTFKICLEYAQKYPEKIELTTVKHNSVGKLLTVAYENIQTKYFCRLDGDDYWCDENKIQNALDFLEAHDDYVTYATDNYMYNLKTKRKVSNIHYLERNKNITGEISFDNFFYVHVSARIHRNVLDFKKKYKNTRKRDRVLYYLLLDAGKAHYEDKVTSVYTVNPNNEYAKLLHCYQRLSQCLILYKINKVLKYKYDKCFTEQAFDSRLEKYKKLFGKVLGWEYFIFHLKYMDAIKRYFKIMFETIFTIKNRVKNIDKFTGDFRIEEFPVIDRVREEMV